MTPIRSLPSVSFTAAVPLVPVPPVPLHAAATRRPASGSARKRPKRMSLLLPMSALDPEVLQELGFASLDLVVPERRDDLALTKEIVAGGPRRGEKENLFYEEHHPPPPLFLAVGGRPLPAHERV